MSRKRTDPAGSAAPPPQIISARSDTIACTLERLERLGVRALAVVDRGEVIGIVDARMLLSVRGSSKNPLTVGDVMSTAFAVEPRSADVSDWARRFAERRLDGIVVVEGGSVVGLVQPTPAPRRRPAGGRRRRRARFRRLA